jgi:uncharacterized protein
MAPRPDGAVLSEFVLKVHGRCDLACDHCYVYEHRDQSWRRRPARMEPGLVSASAERIAEHARRHGLTDVSIILHGGEPLLLGPIRMREILTELSRIVGRVTRLHLGMQTNGVLLSERFCDLLTEFGVRVGVSLDGDRDANDLHRRFRNGVSSHDKVLAGIALLRQPQYRAIYSGLLCTVDARSDPVRTFDALMDQQPPRIDFLLPHATWENRPWRPDGEGTPYARWLSVVHDCWVASGRPVRVRLFESLLSTAAGGTSGSESLGLDSVGLAVIETDGEWEQTDSLKTAYDGAPSTGMTVLTHSADEVAASPELARRRQGLAGLSATCRSCEVVNQCGGGLLAHRYRDGSFDNPSVYCADLKELTHHVNSHAPHPAAVELDTGLLPWDLFDRIASGADDGVAVARLAEAQATIVRSLLVGVADAVEPGGAGIDGWAVLTGLESTAPEAVDRILAHPYVRSWAVDCLSATGPGADQGSGYLSAIAASVAITAGASAVVTVPVRGGRAHLPSVGTVVLPGSGAATAEIRIKAGSFTVRSGQETVVVRPDGATEAPGWLPTRWLTVGDLSVALEDGDPHRDCHKLIADDRLDAAGARRWAENFEEAWGIIADEVPWRVGGLRAGLRALVPLQRTGDGASEASTARQAFGGVAATATDAPSLAVLLVHEFQHGKMNALLDICDLVHGGAAPMIKVGWRPDPRPAEAVLHGIFAHLAVADIWRIRATRGVDGATAVHRQYRDWISGAVGSLERADALTPEGDRMLSIMIDSMGKSPA